MSIDLTKFYKIAAGILLFLLLGTVLSIACGGENSEPLEDETVASVIETEDKTAESFADALAGQELTTELRVRLGEMVKENSEVLGDLAGQVTAGELTSTEVDGEYNAWLRSAAAEEGLTKEQLERLLLGAVGGRY